MKSPQLLGLVGCLGLVGVCKAQSVAEYGQCGGIGYTGSTTCASPYTCQELNAYFYQCLPATSTTSTTTTSTKTTTTTTTTTHTTSSSTKSTTTTRTSVITAPSGFVGTNSSPSPHFTLNGKPFYFAGTNAYYLPFLDATADMESVFQSMNALGLTVVRTNAYNEVTQTQTYGAYFQLWANGKPTINQGPYGFDRLDLALSLATQYGVKVVLMLTNNWEDFGGMDVYVNQLNPGGYHDTFYTNPTIISAFKNYVSFVVNRYKNNSTVFAWELANEPQCAGSVANDATPGCNATAAIVPWATNMAQYIHSLDPNHLVTLGDIGYFCWENDTSYEYMYQYQCTGGPDSSAVSQIPGIDYTTFHLYPSGSGEPNSWGNTFIQQHAYVQQASGKPTVLEEFGISDGDSTKATVYSSWYQTVEQYQLGGAMYWELGNSDAEVVDYTQSDSNTVTCPTETATCAVIQQFASYMQSLNH